MDSRVLGSGAGLPLQIAKAGGTRTKDSPTPGQAVQE
jgi:hypothetical protein